MDDHTQYPCCHESWRDCDCGVRESSDAVLDREATGSTCRTTHCAGCACHEARQADALVARDATIDRLTADLATATGEIARLRAALAATGMTRAVAVLGPTTVIRDCESEEAARAWCERWAEILRREDETR